MTWNKVWSSNTTFPRNVNKDWLKGTVFCVGSGGSLILAKPWQCIHEGYGLGTAKTITPYEFNYTASKPIFLYAASFKIPTLFMSLAVSSSVCVSRLVFRGVFFGY
jgi:hypothetical protein